MTKRLIHRFSEDENFGMWKSAFTTFFLLIDIFPACIYFRLMVWTFSVISFTTLLAALCCIGSDEKSVVSFCVFSVYNISFYYSGSFEQYWPLAIRNLIIMQSGVVSFRFIAIEFSCPYWIWGFIYSLWLRIIQSLFLKTSLAFYSVLCSTDPCLTGITSNLTYNLTIVFSFFPLCFTLDSS